MTGGHELRIPMVTLFKVMGFGLGLWVVVLLWPAFLLFLVSLLMAVTLHPAVVWMERRHIAPSLAVIMIALVVVGLLGAFVVFLLPTLTGQVTSLLGEFPEFRARILSKIPTGYPVLQAILRELFDAPDSVQGMTILERSLVWGQSAATGLVVTTIVLVLTLYLVLDGKSLYAWFLAFVPRTYREKVAITMGEVSEVTQAYVSGQLLAAFLFASFTAVLLTMLDVPGVAPLALLAGAFNVIPVLGIVLATVPALLLALTVSPAAAITVLVAYIGYHLFETYFLLPRIYGNKLNISNLSVLLALLVGGWLQGIVGALLVLPLVAAYPIIERHWLDGYLNSRVLTDHQAMADAAENGSDEAIDAVLLGERHASEGLASIGNSKQ